MKEHDKTAFRLGSILVKLNDGEHLIMEELAQEYGVSRRTIQRDINERLSYLQIQKNETGLFLDPAYLGKLSHEDIRSFAMLAGVKGLFPTLDVQFLRRIFDETMRSACVVRGHHYEDMSTRQELFQILANAITTHTIVSFWYKGTQRIVKPYRLVNQKGIWYLAAVEDKLKSFSLTKIFGLEVCGERFVPSEELINIIEKSESQWIGNESSEVVFQVSAEVASYFRRRAVIPDQVIEKELEDGGMIVSGRFVDETQALSVVGYWLPHIKILSPKSLHDLFFRRLKIYVTDNKE